MSDIKKVTKKWTKRDGSKIRICDMDDSHIVNTIKMLQRNAKIDRDLELEAACTVEGTLNGEMAQWACECDINRMLDDLEGEQFLHPLFDDLVLDAERRGLKVE